jgi:hypothetical protein
MGGAGYFRAPACITGFFFDFRSGFPSSAFFIPDWMAR